MAKGHSCWWLSCLNLLRIFGSEDDLGMIYPLTVEHVGPVPAVNGVTQVIVKLPDAILGAPGDLVLTVSLRGPASNSALIKMAAP